jgi:hypothetical protein
MGSAQYQTDGPRKAEGATVPAWAVLNNQNHANVVKIRLHNRKSVAKGFSVLKYGYDEALRLAIAARSELLARVEDRPFLHHAVAKRLSR